ncbi:unnamed protein product [Linum trigynum]|uniref:Reverse transcriptase zinc-binding domain-containing protein n=1 Tax=Linum trigynum TaxID=586398 RepID=A0AAV2E4D7_9ROSI
MCRSKHEGGMGFRRFEHFNQALLAKVCWRILNEPDSLIAQVYKGKYFPRSGFLEAQARSRPSWGWQSILFGRQLLSQGLRWQIGNGQTAPLLLGSCIPSLHPLIPALNPCVLPGNDVLRVASVINREEGSWCDEGLAHWFDPRTFRLIKEIPLPRGNVEDRLVWHGTQDGVFTVKSAYHLVVQLDKMDDQWSASVSWMDRPSWIRVWEAPVPPKLRVFLWQILYRLLPTIEALIERKIEVHPRCPVCWAESETLEHLFLECPVARALWDYAGLEYLGQGLPRQTFPLFLKRLLNILRHDHLVMAVTAVLWRIWRSRNWVVFEGKQFGFPALMRQYHQQYQEWINFPAGKAQRGPASPEVEVPPCPMICLWDGATKAASHSAGGMVVKNQLGNTLIARGFQFAGIEDPLVAEALALRKAILWCRDSGFVEVRFEGGCQGAYRQDYSGKY